METTLEIAEKAYISQWKVNSKQHFDDGDYRWVCGLVKDPPYHRILEIGCGAGYSTLSFIQKKFEMISIDSNNEAIECTKKLLEDQGYSVEVIAFDKKKPEGADALLWKADLVHESAKIKRFMCEQKENPIDLIALCNPGGQLTTDITRQEESYLLMGGFSKEEIEYRYQTGNIGLLHKWAMIYATCDMALHIEKPILLVERDSGKAIQETLDLVATDTTCRKVFEEFRRIKDAPTGGIALRSPDGSDSELFWGAALYFPR